jgi:lipopolysaccharide biosynthesis regulator YciM
LFGRKYKSIDKDYTRALTLIIDNRIDQAKDLLVKVLKHDMDNVEAYCRLGILLREKGEEERAARIHRELLLRPYLNKEEIRRVQGELIKDYFKQKKYSKAEELLKKILGKKDKKGKRNDLELKKELLRIYEITERWDDAIAVKKSILKMTKSKEPAILALYLVKKADKVAKKSGRDARIFYKDALKVDQKCVSALIGIGDSYIKEQRFNDAMKFWRVFLERVPDKAFLIFDRLEKVYFQSGNYGEVGKIYSELVERKPHEPHAKVALAQHYKKLGEHKEAIRLCESVLRETPDFKKAIQTLISLYSEVGDKRSLAGMVTRLIDLFPSPDIFTCSECGYSSKEPMWHCPDCYNWQTFGI